MMQQWIDYGKQKIFFDIPVGMKYFEASPNTIDLPTDPENCIRKALEHPVGCSLETLATSGKRVCIICDDVSRPTPAAMILTVLLPRLFALGIGQKDIYFVLALGSHRKMTKDEIYKKLGHFSEEFPVWQSSFAKPDELAQVQLKGEDSISVFGKILESDIRIGIGNIVPHNTLGWSGGGKILFPGVASEATVSRFHTKAMLQSQQRIFGEIENPVRHEIEEWAKAIGLHFIINTILDPKGRLYRVVAGDYVKAHRKGVEYAREVFCVSVPERTDIVLVDSHPSNCDFWQGTKGFNAGDLVTKDGGACILAAPCIEGVGPHPEYPVIMGRDDASELLQQIYDNGEMSHGMDPLAVSVGALLSRMRQRFSMFVYSDGVSEELLHTAGVVKVQNLTELLEKLNQNFGGASSLTIIRSGAEIVPLLPQPQQY